MGVRLDRPVNIAFNSRLSVDRSLDHPCCRRTRSNMGNCCQRTKLALEPSCTAVAANMARLFTNTHVRQLSLPAIALFPCTPSQPSTGVAVPQEHHNVPGGLTIPAVDAQRRSSLPPLASLIC